MCRCVPVCRCALWCVGGVSLVCRRVSLCTWHVGGSLYVGVSLVPGM